MVTLKREDYFFIISPFVLTTLFLVLGYQILVRQTPEARINPESNADVVEFLDSSQVQPIKPVNPFPDSPQGILVSIPQNQVTLDLILEQAAQSQANTLYLSVPVMMDQTSGFTLGGAEQSNVDNVMNWARKFIAESHAQGYHVILSLNINASQTISDPATFALNYAQFLDDWASLANSYGVSSFNPGITLGHPLYSNLSTEDVDKVIGTITQRVTSQYTGVLSVGLCCTTEVNQNIKQFSQLIVIPTPEFPFIDMKNLVTRLVDEYSLDQVIYYDRDRSQITSQMP